MDVVRPTLLLLALSALTLIAGSQEKAVLN